MNKKYKLILLISLILTTALSLLAPKYAQASTNLKEHLDNRDGFTNEGLVKNEWFGTLAESYLTITGVGETSASGGPTSMEPGALQFVSGMIGTVYGTPPASGVYYAHNIFQNLGAEPAYAQGIGFSGLQPILPIWKALRNVTYVLFTLIFIGVGVAIMLRMKISPQAVINIENAIPNVIGALILVTFSYAIAGFMIDMLYVFLGLVINVLKLGGIDPSMFQIGPKGLGSPTPKRVIGSGFYSLIPIFWGTNNMGIGVGIVSAMVGAMIGGLAGAFTGPGAAVTAALGAGAGPILIGLIWSIIALILLFKLFFGLIKAYINIILAIILAPFQIMLGAIPGFEMGGFGKWMKGLFTEIIIFPAVLAVAMIGAYIIQSINFAQEMWIAPLIGPPDLQTLAPPWISWALPLVGASGSGGGIANIFVKAIVGMGFLIITSRIPDIIRKAMQVESPWMSAVGQSLAPGISTITYPARQTWGRYQQAREKAIVDQQATQIQAAQTGLRRQAGIMAGGIPIIGSIFGGGNSESQQTRRTSSASRQERARRSRR